ncbi:MAG: hypothetical protein FJX44_00355 [Alphaproteobacteria bacterium]|nr:hypothetical protein [Alphaproteobacteria bacterium]
MRRSLPLVAATMLGMAALAQPAVAQDGVAGPDFTTATYGGTTIWIGGGVQFLTLPDVRFVGRGAPGNFTRQKNLEGDFWDAGVAGAGGIETALGFWGNMRVSGAVKGFFANIETDDHTNCRTATCTVVDPAFGIAFFGPPVLATSADRDADYWGGQIEFKFARAEPVHDKPDFYRNDYFIAGADIRGIDQDISLRGNFGGAPIYTLKETLDTTYYGGYIGIGGEYSFGFIPVIGPALKNVGGIYDRLGLRTFIQARAGLYSAETDYNSRFAVQFTPFNSRISQSNDELAFIGSVSLETRKQLGTRSSLSLWTDYEYISSVPEVRYNNGAGRPTRIEEDSVFASRTMLRLNIGLGPTQLYDEPLR